jgi:hypothetical protein
MNGAEKKIKKVYFDVNHPAGFGSFGALRRHLNKTVSDESIREFLRGQESYTLHKQLRKRFKRDRIFVTNIDDAWQLDLMDMREHKAYNDGATFILICVDVLSKYAWFRALKNKTGKSVLEAFQDILRKSKRKPVSVTTDKGLEFSNKDMNGFLKSQDIKYFCTENSDIKASIAERTIRTFKQKLWRYFTHKSSFRYVNVLDALEKGYNSSFHRTIGKAPKDVTEENFLDTWRRMYSKESHVMSVKPKLCVGDHVRISISKQPFEKGYENNWSREIFKVSKVILRRPVMYELVDLGNEDIKGRFYEKEIQKVLMPEFHKVEKILRMRTSGNRREALVKWVGYSSKFNSWVDERSIRGHEA